MKSLGEKMNHLPKFEKFNKEYIKECETPKRRIDCNYKLKIDDSFKDSDHNRFSDWQKNSKGKKKVQIFDNDTKKKEYLLTIKKKEIYLIKKNLFFVILKEKEKIKLLLIRIIIKIKIKKKK